MKEEVREAAYAKLNLTLDVAEKRSDGYHEMLMVMQTVSLSDAIELKKTGEAGIRATCNFRYVPTDGRNLAVRAAELFCAKQGIQNQGIRIRMEKKIPVGAGMAGGSADAAAVLRNESAVRHGHEPERAGGACRRNRLGCGFLHRGRYLAGQRTGRDP